MLVKKVQRKGAHGWEGTLDGDLIVNMSKECSLSNRT